MKVPFAYQTEGTGFLLQGGSLLADDQGLGKTYQTLCAAYNTDLNQELPLLIVCPAVALGVWETEIEDFAPDSRSVVVAPNTLDVLGDHDVHIVSIDSAWRDRYHKVMSSIRYRAVVFDEAHNFGNPATKRTFNLLLSERSLADCASRTWFLTGTPSDKHAGQLWPMIASTEPWRIDSMTYDAFTKYYCTFKDMRIPGGKGRTVRVIAGTNSSRAPELRKRLKGWWLRRRKEQVLTDLPPKFRNVVPLTIHDLKPFKGLEDTLEGTLIAMAMQGGDTTLMDGVGLEEGEEPHLSRIQRLLSRAKVPAAIDYAMSLLEGGSEALTVWALHRDTLDALEAGFEERGVRTCRIDGSVPAGPRRNAVAKLFQSQKGPPIFLGQIIAAGVALTLTRANRALMVEATWPPRYNVQAEDRIHRIGQTDSVCVDYLAVRGTVDMALQTTNARRAAAWDKLDPSKQGDDE